MQELGCSLFVLLAPEGRGLDRPAARQRLPGMTKPDKKQLDALFKWLGSVKARGHRSEQYVGGPTPAHARHGGMYRSYQEELRRLGKVDYDDMQILALDLLQRHPEVLAEVRAQYRHVLVDEYQDCNRPQVELALLLQREGGGLTVVGDEDQSIYRFHGAHSGAFASFMRSVER